MNRDALGKTLEAGRVYVFRRSKGRVMLKGETSGHIQEVKDVRIDCAGNSLLIFVKQRVAGCHKGYMSCYFERYDADKDAFTITAERVFDPDRVY
jgi:phosphoribosyl-AMP cyclohydrolase